MRFDRKVLFATGGGSGIGRAVARRFAAEGGCVAVADIDEERAAGVAAALPGSIGLGVDVSQELSVIQAVRRARDQFGRIDCVLNAAGYADLGPIDEWSLERWNRMLSVHAGGTFLVCREVVPIMRDHGEGSILNVSSVAAFVAQPDNAPYGAAKGAILSFSRQLAFEVAPIIRVNTLAPGSVRTGMTEPLYREQGGGDSEVGAALAGQNTLLERIGEPEEIAAAACFLLSDEASFVTGQLVIADGGRMVL